MENTNKAEPKYWEKHLSQCYYLHHKFHTDRAGSEPGTQQWWASDQPHAPWYSPNVTFKLHPQDCIWKKHKYLHKAQGVQYASTLFPWLVYWANIHIWVHLPNNSHLATWPTKWYRLSTCHLHVCQAQTYHGNAATSVDFTWKQTLVIPQTRVTFNDNKWETNQRTIATTWPTATSDKCLSNTPAMGTQL